MGQTGQDAGEEGRICSRKGFSADQFGNQQGMIDPDKPRPLPIRRQLCRRAEIPEFLQYFHAFLEAMPQTGPQRLYGFRMALLLLAKSRRSREVFLTGRS